MKEIPLTRGYVAIVDDCDYDYLMQWKWSATRENYANDYIYAVRTPSNQKTIRMHRVVMGLAGFKLDGYVVDHINGNSLLNTRSNLRLATSGQNITSSHKPIKNKHGYRGVWTSVSPHTSKVSYRAEINCERKRYKLGTFATPEEAAQAYNEAAIRLFGEFARLNVIPSIAQLTAA